MTYNSGCLFLYLVEASTVIYLVVLSRGPGFDSRLYHGDFPCRGRIPVVTMVWVVSRIRFKVETSLTRNHTSINSWLNPRQRSPRWSGPHHERQPAHQLIEYPSTLIADYGKRKRRRRKKEFCSEFWRFFLPQVYSCRPVQGQVQGCVSQAIQLLSILFSGTCCHKCQSHTNTSKQPFCEQNLIPIRNRMQDLYMLKVVNNTTRYRTNVYSRY